MMQINNTRALILVQEFWDDNRWKYGFSFRSFGILRHSSEQQALTLPCCLREFDVH